MAQDLANYQLFTPLQLAKDLVLKNRIVFGPVTRGRGDPKTRAATPLIAEHYEQRSSAGLIISEATAISEQAYGWRGSPALYTEEHAAAWKVVTDRVHAKGGKIFAQLWHMGRNAHRSFNAKNDLVAPSAIKVPGEVHSRDVDGNQVPYEVPRALETDEIPGIVEDYRHSSELAKLAGFDGVEVHAANGYLVDLFLQSATNLRTDRYGGSIENRARFLLEIVDAIQTVWPTDRVAVRLSCNTDFFGMGSPDNYEQFTYVLEKLGERGLAYVSLATAFFNGFAEFKQYTGSRHVTPFDAKRLFKGTVLSSNGYSRDTGEGVLRSGAADLVGFGRAFMSNPDLVERFKQDAPLNPLLPFPVWFGPETTTQGYTDIPLLESKSKDEPEVEATP